MSGITDVCVHQWTVDYAAMADLVTEPWKTRLAMKAETREPISGQLMATLPWYHSFWQNNPAESSTDEQELAERYSSPSAFEDALTERGVETAMLVGHEIEFLPSINSPDYAAQVASAYNHLLTTKWLDRSDVFTGAIVVELNKPQQAIAEIEKYADDPRVVSVLIYGHRELPLGAEQYHPIYEAAAAADLPISVHTSANSVYNVVAGGQPDQFVTFDSLLGQGFMTNLSSMVFHGVFDKYPDLEVVWMGESVGWILHPMWRITRYYRNHEPDVPYDLEKEPMDYVRDSCYVTTNSLGAMPEEHLLDQFEMVGFDRILFGSGFPRWDADTEESLPAMDETHFNQIVRENAARIYG